MTQCGNLLEGIVVGRVLVSGKLLFRHLKYVALFTLMGEMQLGCMCRVLYELLNGLL
jgi:hypothetical protein